MEGSEYRKGYVAGYRDGLMAASHGISAENTVENVLDLPIDAIPLSTRAKNCLTQYGCSYASDIAKMSEHRISVMRNLGPKSAAEIAQWLDENGVCYSAWCKYL